MFLFLALCLLAVDADELSVFNEIFSGYDKNSRSTSGANWTTVVNIAPPYFILLQLVRLSFLFFLQDALEQSVTINTDMQMNWVDPALSWTPSASNGFQKSIKVLENLVWEADISMFSRSLLPSSLKSSSEATNLLDDSERFVEITSEGRVFKSGPQVYTNPCALSVGRFPFDTQSCVFKIGPWVYASDDVAMNATKTSFAASSDFRVSKREEGGEG